jgi:hypothetical protein
MVSTPTSRRSPRRPDLVVLYRSALTESASGRLATLGIPTLVLRHDRLADVGRTARLLGRLTGRPAAGDSVARLIDSTLAGAPPAALRRPRLAFVVWDNPPMTIGGGSFLNELVDLAGGENVFHDIPSASATVSLETIATRDPDWILILSDSAPTRPAWTPAPSGAWSGRYRLGASVPARRAVWAAVAAYSRGRGDAAADARGGPMKWLALAAGSCRC